MCAVEFGTTNYISGGINDENYSSRLQQCECAAVVSYSYIFYLVASL